MTTIRQDRLTTEFESRFMNVYEYPFGENGHYYTASRRKREDLVMFKTDKEYKEMIPDAVTMAVVLKFKDEEPKLLLNYEFRYATARYILAPPAGLIDEEDRKKDSPIISAAIREVREETGIIVKESDKVRIVNPLLFSSPGMTDEGNAIVCVVIEDTDISQLNHDGVIGSEEFDGFELLTIEEAKKVLAEGRDKYGNYFSVYTYICLVHFISQSWEEEPI